MFWLITYSQKSAAGNTLSANCVIHHTHPADWLLEMTEKYPNDNTILLYAIEISQTQVTLLDGEI